MQDLSRFKIAILATDGFEQSELVDPCRAFRKAGATVEIVSVKPGEIRGWQVKEWGDPVPVDRTIDAVKVEEFDALLLPGGQINPDLLRTDPRAVGFVRDFVESGKTVGAICHGPWMLVEADVLRGRKVTSYHSIKTDVKNAGAKWVDEQVVLDGNLVTSRKPDDIPAFIDKVAETIEQKADVASVGV